MFLVGHLLNFFKKKIKYLSNSREYERTRLKIKTRIELQRITKNVNLVVRK